MIRAKSFSHDLVANDHAMKLHQPFCTKADPLIKVMAAEPSSAHQEDAGEMNVMGKAWYGMRSPQQWKSWAIDGWGII